MLHKTLLVIFIFVHCHALAAVASDTRVEERLEAEKKAYENSFVLLPHKTNYLLLYTWQDKPNEAPFAASGTHLQHSEVKFQFSVKMPVTRRTLLANNGYFYVGYSARSFFQAYNHKESSPFRDTNHEAELMLNFTDIAHWSQMDMPLASIGFSHQSNGQRNEFSRSWNRLYIDMTFHHNDIYVSLKPWWRIPEAEKRNAQDLTGDDNPDINRYYGNVELRIFREFEDNELSIMLRNNMKSTQRGAVEINYSYPFDKKVKGYVQLFHGYGETLLDYNHANTRIGFGFMFNNWF